MGFSCKCQSAAERAQMTPFTLEYWTIFNDSSDYTEIIKAYKEKHPNVTINVTKKRLDEFEDQFFRQSFLGTGPDIISVNTNWLRKYKDYLSPMPKEYSLAEIQWEGPSCKREKVVKSIPHKSLSPSQVKEKFIDTME